MSSQFPLRSYARGDASSSYKGRSGTSEVGAILSHDGQDDIEIVRTTDASGVDMITVYRVYSSPAEVYHETLFVDFISPREGQ